MDGVNPFPVRERVAVFGARQGMLGILTTPVGDPQPDAPSVLLLTSGIIHRVGSNRLSVMVARALGAIGLTVLRFDFSGIGDSERRPDATSLRESVEQDIAEAIEYLARTGGAERFILMGLCSGAYDALHYAARDPRVVGAIMVDLPGPFQGWRHHIHTLRAKLLRSTVWRSPFRKLRKYARTVFGKPTGQRGNVQMYVTGGRSTPSAEWMQRHFDILLGRDVKLYFVFTAGIATNYNHRSQFRTSFPEAARDPGVTWEFFPQADHAFSSYTERKRLLEFVVSWLCKDAAFAGVTTEGGGRAH